MSSTGLFNIVLGVGMFLYGRHRENMNTQAMAFLNFKLIGIILFIAGVLLTLAGLVDV